MEKKKKPLTNLRTVFVVSKKLVFLGFFLKNKKAGIGKVLKLFSPFFFFNIFP